MKKVVTSAILLFICISAIILPYHTISHTTPLLQNIQKRIYYQDIVTHAYCIKCLTDSTHLLSRLDEQRYHYKPCNMCEQHDYIQIDTAIFSYPAIRNCIKKIVATESLQPLIQLLHKVKHHRLIHNNKFFHEVLILIFTIYKQILFNECEKKQQSIKKSTLETIMLVNNIINQLPIAEILSTIDMLVTELPPFFEKYELHSHMSWKNWFKKYWWVPPVFGIWFGLKILYKLQRPYFLYTPYFSSPLAPRPQIPLDQPIIIPVEPVIVEPIITNDPILLEIRKKEIHS
jgi:hypothetical protein